jgi:hypothetical protein
MPKKKNPKAVMVNGIPIKPISPAEREKQIHVKRVNQLVHA